MNLNIPYMETDNKLLNDAYRIAAGDIVGKSYITRTDC